jgi:hypothetical protein
MGQTFNLWHPVISEDRGTCSFDVTSIDVWQICHGTAQLIDDFMAAIRFDGFAKSWKIEPFCSPFFADNMHETHWVDRCVMAWRVRVDLQMRYHSPFFPFRAFPAQSDALDATAPISVEPGSWIYSRRRAIVIADFAEVENVADVVARIGEELDTSSRAEHHLLGPEIVQARIDLGEVDFPEAEARVMKVVEKLRSHAAMTNWRETLQYSMEI